MTKLPIIDNCDNCGACCRHMRTPPHIVYGNPDGSWGNYGGSASADYHWLTTAPAEAQKARLDRIKASYQDIPDESPCAWLDLKTMRCKWHEHRPSVCRDFEVGGEACVATRKAYGIHD